MSAEGDVIADRYRLLEKIGGGAMGTVWRAADERLHRTVAVKQLLLQRGHADVETEEARQRAMREGRLAARLQHPNTVVVHDVVEHDGLPVLVMEYVPSRSLAQVLGEQGVLAPLTVAGIGAQVAAALAAAHAAGIVHRDLKPGNILLAEDGTAKITDFGISRAMGDVSLTRSGVITGTLAYLAPETAMGGDPAPASDVFSLGATLYAAIDGEPPFGLPDNAVTLLLRVARGHVTPPRNAGPLTEVLMAMLHPEPADRPTMAQVQNLVLWAFNDEPLAAAATAPPALLAPAAGAEQSMTKDPQDAIESAPPEARSTPDEAVSPPPRRAARTAVREDPGNDPPRRRSRLFWAGTALIAVVFTVPNVVNASVPGFDQPTQQEAQRSSAEIESIVRTYYSLTPEDLDRAFDMLGPDTRSQGKESYKKSWAGYVDSRIVGPLRISGDFVVLTVDYTLSNGAHQPFQVTLTTITAEDGRLLLNIVREAPL